MKRDEGGAGRQLFFNTIPTDLRERTNANPCWSIPPQDLGPTRFPCAHSKVVSSWPWQRWALFHGDLGTNTLFAIRQCFKPDGLTPTPDHVLSVLSLVFWVLTLVVVLKYLIVVLRADNRGEGGILALLALTPPS